MARQHRAWMTAWVVWAMAGSLHAQSVPALLPVQGSLADGSGTRLDGEVNVTFRLYADELDDSPLYEETQAIMVDDGRFTGYVGDVTELDLSLLRDNPGMWIGIAIEDDDELPRFALATVPYAAMAEYCEDANSLGGRPASDYALASELADAVDPKEVQVRILGRCASGQFVIGINEDGTPLCADETGIGTGTSYTAGSGLTLVGTEFAIDTAAVQAPTASSCDNGQYVASIAADGTTTCADDESVSGSCNPGQFVSEIDVGGNLVCSSQTSYAADGGLSLDGTTFSIAADGVDSSMVADGSLSDADLAPDAAGTAQMAPASGGEAFAINFGGVWDSIDTFSGTPYATSSGTTVCMMAVNARIENDTLDGGLVGAVPIYRVSGAVQIDTAGGLEWTDVATSLTNNNTVVTSVGVATLMPNTTYDFGCRIRIPMDVADNTARCHLQYACF